MSDDLPAAIAHIKKITPPAAPWNCTDLGGGRGPVLTDSAIATILNAIASGDLVLRADLNAANERAEKAEALVARLREGEANLSRLLNENARAETAEADAAALQAQVERMQADVTHAEIDAAIASVQFEKTPAKFNDNPLYVARIVKYICTARAALAPSAPEKPNA